MQATATRGQSGFGCAWSFQTKLSTPGFPGKSTSLAVHATLIIGLVDLMAYPVHDSIILISASGHNWEAEVAYLVIQCNILRPNKLEAKP